MTRERESRFGVSRRIGFLVALLSGLSACTVRAEPKTPSKYDTRKVRRDFTVTPAIDPTLYLDSLVRRAGKSGCSGGMNQSTAIIDCGDDVHLELTPKEKSVEVACFAISIATCRKELARIEAQLDPLGSR